MFNERFRTLPVLETTRLSLRPLRDDDASAVFEYARLPRVAQYTSWSHHRTIDETRAYIEWTHTASAAGMEATWAIEEKDSGQTIGTASFARFEENSGTVEIGYVLHPDQWGNGFAAEVVKELVWWAFESPDLRKIVAHRMAQNVASARVMEKCGFRRDGVLRAAHRKDGIPVDLCAYSLLRREVHEEQLVMREATADDRAAIENITLLAFQHNPATGLPIDGVEPRELSLVRKLLDEQAVTALHVAELNGAALGYILYARGSHAAAPELHVEGLTVMAMHPLAQRQGWGHELLLWSVARMREQCDLLIVLGHPLFYRQAGFRPARDHGLELGISAPVEACLALPSRKQPVARGKVDYHPLVSSFA